MKTMSLFAAVVTLFVSAAASAQTTPDVPDPAVPAPEVNPAYPEPMPDPTADPAYVSPTQPLAEPDTSMDRNSARWTRRVGLQIEVGGGAQGFLDGDATSITDPGGSWTARAVVGTRSHIAGEVAYVGSAQALDVLGVADRANIMSNGVEGMLRVNILTGALQPYVGAGYTWRHYNITNSSFNTSSVADKGNVSEIPIAAGLAYRFRPFVLDTRFNLHNAFATTIIPEANLSTWGVDAKVGFEF
jgi:hypothetical protein